MRRALVRGSRPSSALTAAAAPLIVRASARPRPARSRPRSGSSRGFGGLAAPQLLLWHSRLLGQAPARARWARTLSLSPARTPYAPARGATTARAHHVPPARLRAEGQQLGARGRRDRRRPSEACALEHAQLAVWQHAQFFPPAPAGAGDRDRPTAAAPEGRAGDRVRQLATGAARPAARPLGPRAPQPGIAGRVGERVAHQIASCRVAPAVSRLTLRAEVKAARRRSRPDDRARPRHPP